MERMSFFYTRYVRLLYITKFQYKDINKIPALKSIDLKFNFKNINNLLPGLVALQLLSNNKPFLQKEVVKNKKSLKPLIKGCGVSLVSRDLFSFFDKLVHIYLSKLQFFKGLPVQNLNNFGNYHYSIEDISIFAELEDEFENFISLKDLKIDFFFSETGKSQNLLLFRLCNLPL